VSGARTWSVHIVEVGQILELPLSLYVPTAPENARLDVPVYVYILQGNDGTTVLVDTGYALQRSLAAGRTVTGDPVPVLLAALERVGSSPDQVQLVLHTHLHYDHAQNDHLFPNAEIVVARDELTHALSPGAGEFYDGVQELVDRAGARLRLIDGEKEVLPGIRAVPNGGHTPGHQSWVVSTADGVLCLCGDIVSLAANLEGPVGPICPDEPAVHEFLRRMADAGWEPLPGHEPGLRRHRLFLASADRQVRK
jgi:glyoxylase-like metal-dependent hydrolase (beta-lactamase superfamily II)